MARTRTKQISVAPDVPVPRAPAAIPADIPAAIVIDPYRAVIFPNRIRERRRGNGFDKLMALSDLLPDIPYIRLSKIERGEVVARVDELRTIATALGTTPDHLLVDVEDPDFDIARWAQPFQDGRSVAVEEERVAVVLAAALRRLRSGDRALTIAVLDEDYGLPPVILSRLENAQKTLDRWNAPTVAALCRLFDVADEAALRTRIDGLYRRGDLDGHVGRIADPQVRIVRTRERNAALLRELDAAPDVPRRRDVAPAKATRSKPAARSARIVGSAVKTGAELAGETGAETGAAPAAARTLPVYGTPLPGGLIAAPAVDGAVDRAVDAVIDAPAQAGSRAFGLRVCRSTLGAGLPAGAIVVVDPDRRPVAGGLAAMRVEDGFRLLTVTFDRTGATKGYSVTPDVEIALDDLDPRDVHAVIGAIFPT